MSVWHAMNPVWPAVHLRLVAYLPELDPPGCSLRIALQVVEKGGHPVAVDPIWEGRLSKGELEAYLLESLTQGWAFVGEDQESRAVIVGLGERLIRSAA